MTIVKSYRYRIIPRYNIYRYNDIAIPTEFNSDVQVTNVPVVFNTRDSTDGGNWRMKIRLHQDATTGRTIDRFKASGGVGSMGVEFVHFTTPKGLTNAGDIWSGHFIYPSSYPSLPSSSAIAENEARMKFFKQAKRAQTALSGMTFLGELGESLRMIRNPGRALRRGLDDYVNSVKKRTRRAKRSSLNRIVSETWLEHVFGWAPLIGDIKSAGEGLNRRLNRFMGSYTRISGRGQQESSAFDAALNTNEDVWLQYYTRRLHRTYSTVRYVAEIRSVCENPIKADMRLFGFDWREAVPTAWELLPYSFLLDYFSNIGDVLNAWSVRKGDIGWCNRTERLRSVRTLSELRLNKTYTQNAVTDFRSWRGSWLDTSYFRSVREQITRGANEPGYPSFRAEIPGFGTKWINMSALLASRNRTRRQLFR